MSNQYIKKPIVIEAIQYTGDNKNKIHDFTDDAGHVVLGVKQISIQTLEGEMKADPSDWIVKGIKGEFYPVRNDIFHETYQKVD